MTHQNNSNPTRPQGQARTIYLRQQIHKLRNQHGDILNTWPDAARDKFELLDKELRQLENDIPSKAEQFSRAFVAGGGGS